ncbi:MAG: hypothetical protein NT002_12735 [candidate division Zixibacteria bacterium]|nr:hypothetical protein [candidate division Zixibacteria bacterium]
MSISEKQLIANRANAQKSTGPKTDQGKETVGHNAVKHGIYSADIIINSPRLKEDPAEYEQLLSSLFEELKPQTLLQEHLVRKIVNSLWRSRRLIAAESAQITNQLEQIDNKLVFVSGHGFVDNIEDPDNDSISPEDKARVINNKVGAKSIPTESFNTNILRYEMRLDRQLTRAYTLLRLLQQGQKAKSPPDSNETF